MVLLLDLDSMPSEGDIVIETPSFHDDTDHLYCAHLPVHESLSKKRKLASPNHFKNKRVQRIHDTSTSPPWTPLYPGLKLEQEALQYIHKFYCKDCQMDQQAAERAKAAADEDSKMMITTTASLTSGVDHHTITTLPEVKQEPSSPMSPQQMTDEASLMVTLDKNKESLKRKLLMRRSLNELVDQGIIPSPKTPLAFMEQRKSLERAKIGDSLRFKISHRPDRQQLVQQHILEDTNIDPSLHERQRLLKKARLADSLNDKLSHRPGVLELVQGNIIQTDGKLHQLIKEGSLSFDKCVDGEECSNDSNYDEGKSSDEALSPDLTDDSNLSDISSPPIIPPAPELPSAFTKSLPFSAQIQFHQDSKVTLPLSTQAFTIPPQSVNTGGFGAATTFASPRNTVTVSTINSGSKSRPKKSKPKPQPKAKVIKFHEYKGPPNIVKSTQPVSSASAIIAGNNNIINNSGPLPPVPSQPIQQQPASASDTPYHILLQQQQLFLQWQLEFSHKNINATTVLVPTQKDGQPAFHTITSNIGSSCSSLPTSSVGSSPITLTTQAPTQTVFTVTPTSQHAQPPAQIQQIRIASPVMSQVKQEPQLGQPQPQMNANVTPVNAKPAIKKPTVNTNLAQGTPKQYTSLEEMKVAELKAELKKRNLTVSGPKPSLIERLKPYADAILKCPIDKSPSGMSSPSSSVLSPTGSLISSKSATSPQTHSVLSPVGSVTSPQSLMNSSKSLVISPPGSVIASSCVGTSFPIVITTQSGLYGQPSSVQSNSGNSNGAKSPGSVSSSSSMVSPPVQSNVSSSNSVFSRPGSVMSPLGSVIDETLCTNADSPLASIQSMQSAVSVSNMTMIPDDLSNPFSPPQSPLFMENIMTPLSPDLMDIHVQSPGDLRALKSSGGQGQGQSNNSGMPNLQNVNNTQSNMEQSRPPSVLSLAPSEPDKHDIAMDIDLDLNQSLSTGPMSSVSMVTQNPPPPPPLPSFSHMSTTNQNSSIQAQQIDQQQMLNQIQAQLRILQEKQKLNQKQQLQQASSGFQMSQEDLLKQQQEKIEKLQAQLEESQLRLQLQQLQHQQLQQQQQQLQVLQQQALQQSHLQQQQQHMQQNIQTSVAQKQQTILNTVSQQQQHQQQLKQQQQQLHLQQQQHSPQNQQQQTTVCLSPQSQQPVSMHVQQVQPVQTIRAGQSKVSVHSQPQKGQQITIQGQPQVKLQGQPQTVAQGQPPLAVQVPRSSPVIVSSQAPASTAQQKSPQHNGEKPTSTNSAQVIFSVPNVPNGNKPPTLATLPPNMKQIQIPAHLLQAFQTNQFPAVIVAPNTKTTTNSSAKRTKAPNLEFIKNQAINQTLNLTGGRSLIAVSTATGGTQQFIIATAPTAPKTSMNNVQNSNPVTMNGFTQPVGQKMTTSVPTSPVDESQQQQQQQSSVSCCNTTTTTTNPYFIPMKEPPKYDEVVRNKQNKGSEKTGCGENVEKSQTMDDVLEILIRTGELPASAAQEPPLTPNVSQSGSVTTVAASQSTVTTTNSQYQNQSISFSKPTTHDNIVTMAQPVKTELSEMKGNIDSVYVPMEGLISASAAVCGIKTEMKTEPSEMQSTGTLNVHDVSDGSTDFFDLNDVINTDLNAMDWTPDPAFGDLDLTDMNNGSSAMDLMPNEQNYLSIPNVKSPQRSNHGSEPDLANLGLADMDTNSSMQIDVPDWLDVIMPNTGLTPLSANAPVSFPADPILTPQTQKEVLDLFNFDESDLNTPSDLNCPSAWEKLTETTSN
ncbi:kinase mkl2 MAPK-like protein [Mactra antiquata]